MKGIKVLFDRLLVQPSSQEEVSAGGIHLPENMRTPPTQGTVVVVGEGARTDNGELIPLSVQVGDTVVFGKSAGVELTIEDTKYLVFEEKQILAILDK